MMKILIIQRDLFDDIVLILLIWSFFLNLNPWIPE